MCSYGASEVSAGAGERVDGMVNGISLAPGSIAGSGTSGGGRIMEAETSVHNSGLHTNTPTCVFSKEPIRRPRSSVHLKAILECR